MKSFFLPEPVIFANGGGVKELPSNTLLSFRRAVELGADVISTGIRLTKDKKIVLIPTEELSEISNGKGAVSDLTLKEIKILDAGYRFYDSESEDYPLRNKGISFLSLEDLLGTFPEQRFNIEIMEKSIKLTEEFCRIIETSGAEKRILTSSFFTENLVIVRERFKDMATSFSMREVISFYGMFRSGILFFKKKFKADALVVPETLGPSHIANQGLISKARKKGLRVIIYDSNERSMIERLQRSGVHGFVTNDIESTVVILKELPNFDSRR